MPDPELSSDRDAGLVESGLRPSLVHFLWKRKWIILLGLVTGGVLAELYYSQQQPIYQASSSVLIIRKEVNLPQQEGPGYRNNPREDYLATQIHILQSPYVLSRASGHPDLAGLQTFQGRGDPTGVIMGGLTVVRDMSASQFADMPSNVLKLTFRGSVPGDCPVILNAVTESYKKFLDDTYKERNQEATVLIEQARDLLTSQLNKLQTELAQLREQTPTVSLGNGTNIHQTRLASIENQRNNLIVAQAQLEARLQAINKALADKRDPGPLLRLPVPLYTLGANQGASGQPVTTNTKEARLASLREQEQDLAEHFGPDHPQLTAVRRKIKRVEEGPEHAAEAGKPESPPAIAKEIKEQTQALEDMLDEVKTQRATLDLLYDKVRKEAAELTKFEVKEEELKRKIASTQQLYDSILRRLQGMELTQGSGGYDAKVLAPPGVGAKVEPRPTPIFGMGIVLGLVAGCGVAWLAEIRDKSFKTPDEIRRRLGLPILGHTPYLDADGKTVQALPDSPRLAPTLVAYHRSKSMEAESYRGVRTSLYYSMQGGGRKVIQITSPNKGDGKSTLAANLAVSIAQSGKTVLLVDADFRRPRQHRLFGASNDVGLVTVIQGEAELDDAIQPTILPGLSILACGQRPPNPAELLTSLRFEELLQALRERYDFVLVDTPPLLAVSDPSIVAARVDGVLLTIRISQNARPAAERATEVLTTLGVNILGVVVNGAGRQAGYQNYKYGYGYGYSYGYGYGYGYGYSYGYDEENGSYYQEEDAEGEKTNGSAKRLSLRGSADTNGHGDHPRPRAEGPGERPEG